MSAQEASASILAMERRALDRWGKGDPDGFLEISDPDVVYFDPFQPRRIDGIVALRQIYDELRGKIRIDSSEMIDPKVTVCDGVAILTFQFVTSGSENEMSWNTTEVYRKSEEEWRIVHSHWSFTQPRLANSPES